MPRYFRLSPDNHDSNYEHSDRAFSKRDFTVLKKRIDTQGNTLSTLIRQNADAITLKANQTDVSGLETKYAQLRIDVDGVRQEVSEFKGGNVIPDFNGGAGFISWEDDDNILSSQEETSNSNSAMVINIEYPGDHLSAFARSPLVRIPEGGGSYSLYTRASGQFGNFSDSVQFFIEEYDEDEVFIQQQELKLFVHGEFIGEDDYKVFTSTKSLNEFTNYVRLKVEVWCRDDSYIHFKATDSSFAFGPPQPYAPNLSTISANVMYAVTTATQSATSFLHLSETVGLVDGRLVNAESAIIQNANNILLRVKSDNIISTINQSAEAISINANKINLSGFVTISNLSDGMTTISGANIRTGTIDVQRIPNFSADKITVGVLHADRIPSINADKITVGVLHADRIPSINASKITTGTLNADRVVTARLTSGSIGGWTISSTAITKGSLKLDAANNRLYLNSGAYLYAHSTSSYVGVSGGISASGIGSFGGRVTAQGGLRVRVGGYWFNATLSGMNLVFQREIT